MKAIRLTIYLFTILIILFSCQPNSKIMDELLLADSFMETQPDSALAILEKITSNRSFSKKETATYALFLTKARFKNYIPVDSDSLINLAAEYFLDREDGLNKVYTYYYLGQINAGLNEPNLA